MKKGKNEKRKVPLVLSMVLFLWIVSAPALASGTSTEYNVSTAATHFPQNKQNEAPMAVNPTDPNNIITGANDEIEEPDCTPATGGSSDCSFKPNTD